MAVMPYAPFDRLFFSFVSKTHSTIFCLEISFEDGLIGYLGSNAAYQVIKMLKLAIVNIASLILFFLFHKIFILKTTLLF